ncbi:MAG TPA: HEAT repeat domain-containing protein [Deltaproteobacteria bacterium]|nr:HEAT repeat domain-containing protein [Deltaproteobacteria bacterium]
MSTELASHTNILIELNKAVKTLHFYPKGHPNLSAILSNCFTTLKEAASAGGGMKWRVDQKRFYVDGRPVEAAQARLEPLARQFFLRRIREITYLPGLTEKDLSILLSILTTDAEAVEDKGGVERMLAEMGARGILLNEMRYEDLERLGEEGGDEGGGEEGDDADRVVDGAAEKAQPPQAEEPDGEAGGEAATEADGESGESVEGLLERLAAEEDLHAYTEITVKLKERTLPLLAAGGLDEAMAVLSALAAESLPGSSKPVEFKGAASLALGELLTVETVAELVGRLATTDEAEISAVGDILRAGDNRTVNELLVAMTSARDLHVRRHVYNILLSMGERIRGELEERLNADDPLVVRQVVSLLGDMALPHSLDSLTAAYGHRDVKVRKEVLKAVARIPSPRSVELLLGALHEGDDELALQAVISLGALRESSAVDALGEIALRKDSFSDNPALRKEAVKALGAIGDRSAVPYLARLLEKRRFLFGRKTNEELKVAAVLALGRIGGDEAAEVVRAAAGDAEGELYRTCRKVLEGMDR